MAYKVDSSKINYSGLKPHKRDYNFKIDCNCEKCTKEWKKYWADVCEFLVKKFKDTYVKV